MRLDLIPKLPILYIHICNIQNELYKILIYIYLDPHLIHFFVYLILGARLILLNARSDAKAYVYKKMLDQMALEAYIPGP